MRSLAILFTLLQIQDGLAGHEQKYGCAQVTSSVRGTNIGYYDAFAERGERVHLDKPVVKGCPSTCFCRLRAKPVLGLSIGSCKKDLLNHLPTLFNNYPDIQDLAILYSRMSRFPIEITQLKKLHEIIFINNNLKTIPENVFPNLTGLTEVYIMLQDLKYLPSDMSALTKLQVLSFPRNMMKKFPKTVFELSSLQCIDAKYNWMQSIPHTIEKLKQLKHLILRFNNLRRLPGTMQYLNELQSLYLGRNRLGEIPHVIYKLSKLKNLDLSGNYIKGPISHAITNLSLRYLDLGRNQITSLPELSNMYLLQEIRLANNSLTHLPKQMPPNLRSITLSYNQLVSFPCRLLELESLQQLQFNGNNLTKFDCHNITSTGLEILSLYENKISNLPCHINAHQLTKLYTQNNRITDFPEGCFLLSKGTLTSIDLSYNRLTTLDLSTFCQGQTFQTFNFRHNLLYAIHGNTREITRCFGNAVPIIFAQNKLTELESWPLEIALKHMVHLDISANEISNFTSQSWPFTPEEFQHGSVLNMQDNKIKHFMDIFDGWNIDLSSPGSMFKLLKNVFFDLGGNPLVCDCVDYDVYTIIQTFKSKDYHRLHCEKPRSLRNQNPYYIPLLSFVCDVSQGCPDHCLCTKVPFSRTINITCYNYKHGDVPQSVPPIEEPNLGYHLNLTGGLLTVVNQKQYFPKLVELILSDNSISKFDSISSKTLENLQKIYLNGNNLRFPPSFLFTLGNRTQVEEVKLGNNPWVCNCQTIRFRKWLLENKWAIKDASSIQCLEPSNLAHKPIISLDESLVCAEENKTLVYIIAGTAFTVIFLIILFAVVGSSKFIKKNIVAVDECEGEGKQFDIFVSYSNEDEDYVESVLMTELDRLDYRVCFHRVHFHGGKPIHVNISEAIAKSKRTLVYFSDNFRDSNFCMFEFNTAHHLDIENNTRRLITIKAKDLDVSDLNVSELHYFQSYTYVRQEDPKFWKNLLYTLPRQRLGAEVY